MRFFLLALLIVVVLAFVAEGEAAHKHTRDRWRSRDHLDATNRHSRPKEGFAYDEYVRAERSCSEMQTKDFCERFLHCEWRHNRGCRRSQKYQS
eukprot:CAMPEP_0177631906 /NCGR_PEP_ID=MMETSP0447-20121125/2001_1 /TAXON_ID=0 /ORGANISM="Stygamoeba regulata, Strain BSH-02190019" /LENGTH=93 /DNA_ID=CAMNT_0019133425 /DNA_START=53 /DNA_END=334 /DNA_ORIENTATION=+